MRVKIVQLAGLRERQRGRKIRPAKIGVVKGYKICSLLIVERWDRKGIELPPLTTPNSPTEHFLVINTREDMNKSLSV